MQTYSLCLASSEDEEAITARLMELGGVFLYSTQTEADATELICQSSGSVLDVLKREFAIASAQPFELPDIDWESQWALHGQGYEEGLLHMRMSDYGAAVLADVYMRPGPGFGDLSHPTTRLCLRLMGSVVRGKRVLDIGCGSGVLSLAAAALGATAVQGIDIDPAAVEHARANAELGDWPCAIAFDLVGSEQQADLILMNMIRSEQDLAWKDLAPLMITSGIRTEEAQQYEAQWALRGWVSVGRMDEDGWCAFLMRKEESAAGR
ncbi:MAG: 50S ribosomal protein L11 methyltransferase [Chlamydiia bacterium]|nr:50S ribosomal protein L11 methyltransferase [Chlamydiia bacterium]